MVIIKKYIFFKLDWCSLLFIFTIEVHDTTDGLTHGVRKLWSNILQCSTMQSYPYSTTKILLLTLTYYEYIQVSRYQVGRYKVGRYQLGRYQVGRYQVGRYQVGRYQVGRYQVGRCQVGRYPVGRYQVGRYRISTNCVSNFLSFFIIGSPLSFNSIPSLLFKIHSNSLIRLLKYFPNIAIER